MSGPDEGMLTAQERAALASLEARASADDPRLAHQLRGRSARARLKAVHTPRAGQEAIEVVARAWSSLAPWVWGPVATAGGLALMVLAMSAGILLGVLGALVAAGGLGLLTSAISRRVATARLEQGAQRFLHPDARED